MASPPIQAQKEFLDLQNNIAVNRGDNSFLISSNWWRKLKQKIENESEESTIEPIDNLELIHGFSEFGNLKASLKEGETENYVLVNENTWKTLLSWYGGGPAISRPVILDPITNCLRADIYPLILNIKSNKSQKFYFSQYATLRELMQHASSLACIAPHSSYLYVSIEGEWQLAMNPSQYKQKKHSGVTLETIGIRDGFSVLCSTNEMVSDFIEMDQAFSSLESNEMSNGESWDSGLGTDYNSMAMPIDNEEASAESVEMDEEEQYTSRQDRIRDREEYELNKNSKNKYIERGLCGLSNLGNTCFMNSTIQCLSNAVPFTGHFLGDKYREEINKGNVFGSGGKLAEEYAKVMKKMWSGKSEVIIPSELRNLIGVVNPQFLGHRQHDSQELLAFLLDGLHEDLNTTPPKTANKNTGDMVIDPQGQDESWRRHIERKSVVVDLFQGQLKSTLICPDCDNISITYDPFLYLSLSLPTAKQRTFFLNFVSAQTNLPNQEIKVNIPNTTTLADFRELILSNIDSCFGDVRSIVICEVKNSKFERTHWNLSDQGLVQSIRNNTQLYVYELLDAPQYSPIQYSYITIKQRFLISRVSDRGEVQYAPVYVGTPIVLSVPVARDFSTLVKQFYSLVHSWFASRSENFFMEEEGNLGQKFALHETISYPQPGTRNELDITYNDNDYMRCFVSPSTEWSLTWANEHVFRTYNKSQEDEAAMIKQLSLEDSIFNSPSSSPIDIYDCLKLFVSQEKLGKSEKWLCPTCKIPQQATKKIDLWRLPEIIIFHLKRFRYNKHSRNKIDAYIDFPLTGLDLTQFLPKTQYSGPQNNNNNNDNNNNNNFENYNNDNIEQIQPHVYDLFAVSNHSGDTGGGHYTAFALNRIDGHWYLFNDSKIHRVDAENVCTSEAYVLFYQKRTVKS